MALPSEGLRAGTTQPGAVGRLLWMQPAWPAVAYTPQPPRAWEGRRAQGRRLTGAGGGGGFQDLD